MNLEDTERRALLLRPKEELIEQLLAARAKIEADRGKVEEYDGLNDSWKEQYDLLKRRLGETEDRVKLMEEIEDAQYATICAVAKALGLEVWGNDELAPEVKLYVDAVKKAVEAKAPTEEDMRRIREHWGSLPGDNVMLRERVAELEAKLAEYESDPGGYLAVGVFVSAMKAAEAERDRFRTVVERLIEWGGRNHSRLVDSSGAARQLNDIIEEATALMAPNPDEINK